MYGPDPYLAFNPLTCSRTTIIEECLQVFPDMQKTVVLAYFYRPSDSSARGFFCSLVKQLLSAFIKMKKPCPNEIRDQIEITFGAANRKPESWEVVNETLKPMLSAFEQVVIILDGIDLCDEEKERTDMWKYLRELLASNKMRLVVSTRDPLDISGHIPHCLRIRVGDSLNDHDIDVYIEAQMDLQSGKGQLFHSPEQRALVKRQIQQKASGM